MRNLQSTSIIKSSWSSPRLATDFLSQDQVEYLKKIQSESDEIEKKRGGIECTPIYWERVSELLAEKIEKAIGPYDQSTIEGNFFKTLTPYFPHVDSGKHPDRAPFKAILIPLSISPENQCGTVFFKQRYTGYATNFAKGTKGFSTEFNQDLFDYKDVHFIENEAEFDVKFHQDYLSHVPISCLSGLSVDTVMNWKIGDVIIFDRTQIHCATNFKKSGVVQKSGLSLFTNSIRD